MIGRKKASLREPISFFNYGNIQVLQEHQNMYVEDGIQGFPLSLGDVIKY